MRSWTSAWCLLAVSLAGCGDGGAPELDASMSDAPGLDAPGADVPGLDAPAPDVPGLDAPGLDAPSLPPGDIATWTDAPGACPSGMPRVDVRTAAELEAASRGEAPYDGDAPATCYFIHDGDYSSSSNVLFWVRRGGDAAQRRLFVGESRDGVVIHHRATINDPIVRVQHVEIRNLTFDLTGYEHADAFNTITVLSADDVVVSHVDLTGDCATGLRGGHLEVEDGHDVVLEDSLVERFGQCTGDGHLDHGVYLASGTNITVRNCEIRENSSRGIQLNTEGGAFGTLDGVVLERNRIHHNGHRDYEDGIVVNATGTGTVANLTIRRNLIYANRYSGLRFAGDVLEAVVVEHNTFADDGALAGGGSPSEINLDDVGSGAATVIRRNILAPAADVLNDCYDAGPRGFSLEDNLVTEASGLACSTGEVVMDPGFADRTGGDFHTASAWGAYAP